MQPTVYSILSLSDSSGAVVERISYTAYGQPTFTNAAGTMLSSSAKATRYSYTGREWDPSLQLHHFRARWMSGVSGRFLGRDPIGFAGGSMLLFQYCHDAPVDFIDPFGREVLPNDRIRGLNYELLLEYVRAAANLLNALQTSCDLCDDGDVGRPFGYDHRLPCDREECKRQATDIANALFHTLYYNWGITRGPDDHRGL